MGGMIIIVLSIALLLVSNAILHIIQPFRSGFNKQLFEYLFEDCCY